MSFMLAPAIRMQPTCCWYDDVFTLPELKRVVAEGDTLVKGEAIVGQTNKPTKRYRKSEVAWMSCSTGNWIADRLAYWTRKANGEMFHFDLWGFIEDFQYTIYNPDKSQYKWHMDSHTDDWENPPRKLSAVLLLSDPEKFEGGDLQLMVGMKPLTLEKKLGRLYFFPSFIVHRVTPVTKGTRKSLVVWVTGEAFR